MECKPLPENDFAVQIGPRSHVMRDPAPSLGRSSAVAKRSR